jgi:EAL domain-containing protein (putative c-di-GMP-specific phosphodiesterase class I)
MSFDVTAEFLPIYEVGSGRLHGFEARARGPKGEHFPELYASAKQANDVAELDRQCVQTALLGAASLSSDYRIFVNVFLSSIAEGRVLSELDHVSLRPEQIVFEIVPYEIIRDYPRMAASFGSILQLGCMFALDGFGTGYSSLSSLKHLPFHYVKAAPDYLDPENLVMDHLLRAIGGVAKSLAKRFVVTGIDSEPHLSTALASGADLVQGFYVGRPSYDPLSVPSSLSMLKHVSG